jgi:hypothetical protein
MPEDDDPRARFPGFIFTPEDLERLRRRGTSAARPPIEKSMEFHSRGFLCEIVCAEGEGWRGYVRLPARHPWVGEYEAGDLLLTVGGQAGREITWSGQRAADDRWWLGFDGVTSAADARRIVAHLARLARAAVGG